LLIWGITKNTKLFSRNLNFHNQFLHKLKSSVYNAREKFLLTNTASAFFYRFSIFTGPSINTLCDEKAETDKNRLPSQQQVWLPLPGTSDSYLPVSFLPLTHNSREPDVVCYFCFLTLLFSFVSRWHFLLLALSFVAVEMVLQCLFVQMTVITSVVVS